METDHVHVRDGFALITPNGLRWLHNGNPIPLPATGVAFIGLTLAAEEVLSVKEAPHDEGGV